jgi:hypothetical protein
LKELNIKEIDNKDDKINVEYKKLSLFNLSPLIRFSTAVA